MRYIYFEVINIGMMNLVTTSEAAELLGVSVRRVRAMIAENKLPAHRIGRDYAIEKESLETVKVYGKAGRPPKNAETLKPASNRKASRK